MSTKAAAPTTKELRIVQLKRYFPSPYNKTAQLFSPQLRRERFDRSTATDNPAVSIECVDGELIAVCRACRGAGSSIAKCPSWYSSAAAIRNPASAMIERGNIKVHQGYG